MFVVLLRFSDNKARAAELMAAHNAWIQQGIDDGVLLLVGSLQPAAGGALLAHGVSRADLDARVRQDPFVDAGVVRAEILEIAPKRADARLSFLLD
ncbi:YciI family protein [Denitromonas sp.]|uniref:YciI family protein n=1 Tax=Denitromonas sp. TaxID=2734609 RepID=UPI002AFF7045|nr:YciI family protein [Denitromonas sp.]